MELLIFPSNANTGARWGAVSWAAWGNSIIKHGGSTHVLVCCILKDSYYSTTELYLTNIEIHRHKGKNVGNRHLGDKDAFHFISQPYPYLSIIFFFFLNLHTNVLNDRTIRKKPDCSIYICHYNYSLADINSLLILLQCIIWEVS